MASVERVLGFAQCLARHPQITQRKQRRDLGSVFHQATASCLRIAKLALDDPECVETPFLPPSGRLPVRSIEFDTASFH